MKVALFTMRDPSITATPFAMVEDDKGTIKYYSKNKERDKEDNKRALDAKKTLKDQPLLEYLMHGYSYYNTEILDYKGENKEKINNFLIALGHKKLNNK